MPKDTFSDKVLFPKCVEVLREELVPMHYLELTEKAVKKLHCIGMATERPINMKRQKEDVRERLLDARKLGTFYLPNPYCYGALQKWFVTTKVDKQLRFAPDPSSYVFVPVTISSAINGTYEALMRSPHMINKGHLEEKDRKFHRSRGLQIESAVCEMFKRNYPEFFIEPDNHQLWATPCSHDFKLLVKGIARHVDVSGRTSSGNFGNANNKRTTDIHLLCDTKNDAVVIIGVTGGLGYTNENLRSHEIHNNVSPAETFIVWLNIEKSIKDATYTKFKEASGKKERRTPQSPALKASKTTQIGS